MDAHGFTYPNPPPAPSLETIASLEGVGVFAMKLAADISRVLPTLRAIAANASAIKAPIELQVWGAQFGDVAGTDAEFAEYIDCIVLLLKADKLSALRLPSLKHGDRHGDVPYPLWLPQQCLAVCKALVNATKLRSLLWRDFPVLGAAADVKEEDFRLHPASELAAVQKALAAALVLNPGVVLNVKCI